MMLSDIPSNIPFVVKMITETILSADQLASNWHMIQVHHVPKGWPYIEHSNLPYQQIHNGLHNYTNE